MSISPKEKDLPQFHPSAVSKIANSTKKVVTGFYANPIHFIFWTSLTVCIIGFFFGVIFVWPAYVTVAVLGIIEIYKNERKN